MGKIIGLKGLVSMTEKGEGKGADSGGGAYAGGRGPMKSPPKGGRKGKFQKGQSKVAGSKGAVYGAAGGAKTSRTVGRRNKRTLGQFGGGG
tara:strand:- start:223 stop:495 length:273 start_codon:yes stop_codon:yes gene_type:complete